MKTQEPKSPQSINSKKKNENSIIYPYLQIIIITYIYI